MKTIGILLAMLAVVISASGFAQETTIEVPQGSGVFPTVGQVNCLEELGSGRLCAATYECSEGSGRLWGDLANHDGRRAIGKDSPVARGRDCTITVDGSAAVRWLTAYSPGGRTGELVGLTTSAEALRPVQRVQRQTGESGGSLLNYILERHNTTLHSILDVECGHIQRGHSEHDGCVREVLGYAITVVDLEETPLTRCAVELQEEACALSDGRYCRCNRGCETLAGQLLTSSGSYRLSFLKPQHQTISASPLQQRCGRLAVELLESAASIQVDDNGRLSLGD